MPSPRLSPASCAPRGSGRTPRGSAGRTIARGRGALPGHDDELRAAWLAIEPRRIAAERIAAGLTEVVSHRSAAVLHELGDLDADLLEFTASVRRQTRRHDVIFHRRSLQPDDWILVDGLPATTPLRTIMDLAAVRIDRGHLAGAVRDAVLMNGVPVDVLAAALAPYARAYGATAGDGHHLIRLLVSEIGVPQPALDVARYLGLSEGWPRPARPTTGNAVDDVVRARIGEAVADLAASLDPTSGTRAALQRWLVGWTANPPAGEQGRDLASSSPKIAGPEDSDDG